MGKQSSKDETQTPTYNILKYLSIECSLPSGSLSQLQCKDNTFLANHLFLNSLFWKNFFQKIAECQLLSMIQDVKVLLKSCICSKILLSLSITKQEIQSETQTPTCFILRFLSIGFSLPFGPSSNLYCKDKDFLANCLIFNTF